MAGERFVAITREEFEDWLDSFAKSSPYKGWVRVSGKAGAYIVKFSQDVGCLIITTLTRRDEVKDVGKASTKMRLVEVQTGRLLNKKASPQIYYRTKGWRDTWKKKGVDWWYRDIYLPSKDFYESNASIKDVDAFVAEWRTKIESIEGWEKDKFLADQHAKLQRGYTLSEKVLAAIERTLSKPVAPSQDNSEWASKIETIEGWRDNDFLKAMHSKARRGQPLTPRMEEAINKFLRHEKADQRDRGSQRSERPGAGLSQEQQAFISKMRAMKDMAGEAGDDWTVQFLDSLITQAGRGRSFSDRQKQILREKMLRYRPGRQAANRIAQAFLAKQSDASAAKRC